MPTAKGTVSNSVLRNLPSVDELLRSPTAREIIAESGERHTAKLSRMVIDQLRQALEISADGGHSKESLMEIAVGKLRLAMRAEQMSGVHRVINATGVVIHTNLGRAPLSDAARRAVADEAAGYCTLEYELDSGKRGKRGLRAESLLAELTGAESVLIVNNCAAAAFFVLTVLAYGGEVVISRGEMVEIGGDFRVPDVLSQSGSTLREVGTTNRTKLSDYEKAINSDTRLLLRVHPSNYRIVGFTAAPAINDLAALAHKHQILLFEDLGSGALVDLSGVGLSDEPVVSTSINAGVDVVTFSGDKLLGGPQAGIIAGKRAVIDRLRQHPLYRVLRVDKLTYAALEATLESFARETAFTDVPILKMLSMTTDELAIRSLSFARKFADHVGKETDLQIQVIVGNSVVGGGSAPGVHPETTLLALKHKRLSSNELEKYLRKSNPPVISRICEDQVVLDLRTVSEIEEARLLEILAKT